jgi:hypothetical protein
MVQSLLLLDVASATWPHTLQRKPTIVSLYKHHFSGDNERLYMGGQGNLQHKAIGPSNADLLRCHIEPECVGLWED